MMSTILQFSLPLICAVLSFMYWRRASIGLEDHLKHSAVGFFVLSLYELVGLASLFRDSQIVWVSKLTAPFGWASIAQYALLVVATVILAKWTWYYLLKRLSTQLFMLALTGAVGLSLLITGLFVTLLLQSVERESLTKLTSNAKVMASLIEEKKARLASETRLFAQDAMVVEAIASGERKDLGDKVQAQMKATGVASLVVTDGQGKIILKGENEEERGVSWSDDKYVMRALSGETVSGIVSRPGVIAPQVSIRVAVPAGGGTIVASELLDNAYVDGLKESTGLSVGVYGDQLLSSTTENIGDGTTRLSGIKETNVKVIEQVWKKGEILAQTSKVGESDYLSAYVPLRDQDNEVSSVLQVSQPQVAALQAAGQAVQMTFALVIMVMIGLSWPIYLVCQKLVKEWE